MKFIYCVDESYANKLKLAGYKLLSKTKLGEQNCWIFNNEAVNQLFSFEVDKVFFTNKLTF